MARRCRSRIWIFLGRWLQLHLHLHLHLLPLLLPHPSSASLRYLTMARCAVSSRRVCGCSAERGTGAGTAPANRPAITKTALPRPRLHPAKYRPPPPPPPLLPPHTQSHLEPSPIDWPTLQTNRPKPSSQRPSQSSEPSTQPPYDHRRHVPTPPGQASTGRPSTTQNRPRPSSSYIIPRASRSRPMHHRRPPRAPRSAAQDCLGRS